MTNNLTLTGATFGAGKFGTGLTGGSGLSTAYPTGSSYTLEAWINTTSSGSTKVVFSIDGNYLALDGAGKITGWGTNGSAAAFNDGTKVHVALVCTASGVTVFAAGNIVATGASVSLIAGKNLTIGTHQTFGFDWVGGIDEFASWSYARYTAPFTPPTAPYAGTESGLVQLYHLDGNGADSTAAAGNNALVGNTSKLVVSPGNMHVLADVIKTMHGGAYFRTIFSGTAATLLFDTTGLATGFPKLQYRVDKTGPWLTVDLAATVVIAVPAETVGYASHFLEVQVRATTRTGRQALQGLVALTGIILDAGQTLSLPPRRLRTKLIFGDSTSEALKSLSGSEDTVNSTNSMQSWVFTMGEQLDAEIGLIGFSGQGFSHVGDGDVPVLGTTYNQILPGVPRNFSGVDTVAILQGENDGTTNIVTQVTALLNGLIGVLPASAKITVFRPFSGKQAANLQAGISACSAPSRVTYADTTDVFRPANSFDGLHPNGFEHVTHIGPAMTNIERSIMAGTYGLAARTVTLTLRNSSGALAANLTGLQVSIFDDPARATSSPIRYQTLTGTTDANGVFTTSYQSALAPGGTCGVDVRSTNLNMAINMTVS